MTIEEKARAYDEALEDMRVIYPNLKGDAKLAVEHAFPQLRESEDERIRKWLIDYFSSIKKTVWIHRDISCEQIIEWLEKQKEPTKEELYAEAGTTENEYIANTMKMVRAMREKQKEQKPVVTHGETYHVDTLGTQQVIAGKMQQKPAWSEEDEAMRDNILRVLSCFVGTAECESNPSLSTSYPLYRREIAWLKSLSSSWKPSEEQMMALEVAFRKDGDDKYRSTINSLYNDLKKL